MLRKRIVKYDDIEFDSRDEMLRYIELLGCQRRGEISGLRLQYSFELLPRQSKSEVVKTRRGDKVRERFLESRVIYTCDFLYRENGVYVVEDVKSWFTRTHASDYPLRRKLMVRKMQEHNVKGHGQWIFREVIVGNGKLSGCVKDR